MAYSASTIVSLACQICNCPGRIIQAGQLMNMILANYAQVMDLDVIRKPATLNIGPQAIIPYFYALPSDYLRVADGDIFYNVQGEVFVPTQITLEEMDAAYTASGVSNYPMKFATDVSQTPQPTAGSSPSIAFYPPPAIPLAVTVKYRPQTTDIVTPESSLLVPWFPNQLVLLKDLCIQVGDVAGGEDRSARWEAEVEKRMSKYLMMDDDKEGYSQTVKLDPRFFRTGGILPPSKKLGF